MPYIVKYHKKVEDDIYRLDEFSRKRIRKAIEVRLMTDPFKYGNQLKGSLKGLRKLRIGDYRIIYEIIKKVVTILGIRHRKEIYKIIMNRNLDW